MELELWAFAEIAEGLHVSRARAAILVNRHDFPAPVATLSVGRIWLASEVRAWVEKRRKRYPGLTGEDRPPVDIEDDEP